MHFDKEKTLAHWQSKSNKVKSLNVWGEPRDLNGYQLCTNCFSNNINDSSPVWSCNDCGEPQIAKPIR